MSFWTEDRERKLVLLVADGFSASQIAEKIGAKTRIVVIGKASRMGLQLKGAYTPPKSTRPPRLIKMPKPRKKETTHAPVNPLPTTLTERGRGCAFPISGAGADTLFCAGHTDGKRYCAKHRAVMYEPPKPASVQRRSEEASLWAAGR
jgi:hypothetical protein